MRALTEKEYYFTQKTQKSQKEEIEIEIENFCVLTPSSWRGSFPLAGSRLKETDVVLQPFI
jgi:hypothetical protein